MKQSRFTDEQIIGFLKQADAGMSVKELCRSGGFSQPTFYKWRSRFGGMVLSALLAAKIPARRAITFGQFDVRADSTGRHQLYYGRAMVEAYRAEQREKWIGITIQPSAWRPYESENPGNINTFASEGVWLRREDNVLLLNPFIKLRGWSDLLFVPGEVEKPYSTHNAPEFPNDLLGLKFLRETADAYAMRNDFHSPAAVKYHVTIAFLKKIIGEKLYSWAETAVKPENFYTR